MKNQMVMIKGASFEQKDSYGPPLGFWPMFDDPASHCFDAIEARDYLHTPIPEA